MMATEIVESYSNQLGDEVIVRKARSADVSKIYDILALEKFLENELPPIKQLLEDGFGTSPWFDILLAERGTEVLGVAVYDRSYWSWTGRTLRLCALVVRCDARRRGVGATIFRELCRISLQENAQLEWTHPASNSIATAFFAKYKSHVKNNLNGINLMKMPLHTDVPKKEKRANKEMYVRTARMEDMAELRKTIHEISASQHHSSGPELEEKDLIEDAFLSSPAWFFALVACRGGNVVGAVMGSRSYSGWSRSVYMQSLYVRSSARRCGVADKLIHAFNQLATEEGAQWVYLNVSPSNAPAMQLYAHYGAVCVTSDDLPFRLDRKDIKELFKKHSNLLIIHILRLRCNL